MTRNAKYFFSYAKRFLSVKSKIGPLIDSKKNIVSASECMANMLADQYSSVFSKPLTQLNTAEEIFSGPSGNTFITDIVFSEKDFQEAIDDISKSAASGPNGFPAILLKECKKELAAPLVQIWRTSLDAGLVPQIFKEANVIPIHKGDSKGTPANYRPVALTSHLIKIFEKVVRKNII